MTTVCERCGGTRLISRWPAPGTADAVEYAIAAHVPSVWDVEVREVDTSHVEIRYRCDGDEDQPRTSVADDVLRVAREASSITCMVEISPFEPGRHPRRRPPSLPCPSCIDAPHDFDMVDAVRWGVLTRQWSGLL